MKKTIPIICIAVALVFLFAFFGIKSLKNDSYLKNNVQEGSKTSEMKDSNLTETDTHASDQSEAKSEDSKLTEDTSDGNSLAKVKSEEEKIAEAVLSTAKLEKNQGASNNDFLFSYSQPEIPKEYHLGITLEIYSKTGATEYRYSSDEGWLNDASKYDASARDVQTSLDIESLSNRKVMLTVKCGDETLSQHAAIYQLLLDFDKTKTLTKVFISMTEGPQTEQYSETDDPTGFLKTFFSY